MATVIGWQNIAPTVARADRRTDVIDVIRTKYPEAVETREGPVFVYWHGDQDRRLVGVTWLLHSRWTFVVASDPTVTKDLVVVPLDTTKARVMHSWDVSRPKSAPVPKPVEPPPTPPPPAPPSVVYRDPLEIWDKRQTRRLSQFVRSTRAKRKHEARRNKYRLRNLSYQRKNIVRQMHENMMRLDTINHEIQIILPRIRENISHQMRDNSVRLDAINNELNAIDAYFAEYDRQKALRLHELYNQRFTLKDVFKRFENAISPLLDQYREREALLLNEHYMQKENLKSVVNKQRVTLENVSGRFERSISSLLDRYRQRQRHRRRVRWRKDYRIDFFDLLLDTDWESPRVRAIEYWNSFERYNGGGCRWVRYEDLEICDYETYIGLYDE